MADADADRLTGKPDLLGRALVGAAFPFGGWHEPGLFARNVDPGEISEAELAHEIVHVVDAESFRDRVEINVARLLDRVAHGNGAMPLGLPVPEQMAAARQTEMAGAENRLFRGHDAVLECGQREERLDGRAGRIGAAQGTVDQGLVDIALQRLVLLGGEAAREGVGVETRGTRERKDIAGMRIDGDGGSPQTRECRLGGALHAHVETQYEIRPCYRLARGEYGRVGSLALYRPAGGIHQHFTVSRSAVQFVFVGAFDAQLADQRGAGVRRRIDALEILFADGGNVTERMHRHDAEWVMPRQPCTDVQRP